MARFGPVELIWQVSKLEGPFWRQKVLSIPRHPATQVWVMVLRCLPETYGQSVGLQYGTTPTDAAPGFEELGAENRRCPPPNNCTLFREMSHIWSKIYQTVIPRGAGGLTFSGFQARFCQFEFLWVVCCIFVKPDEFPTK